MMVALKMLDYLAGVGELNSSYQVELSKRSIGKQGPGDRYYWNRSTV